MYNERREESQEVQGQEVLHNGSSYKKPGFARKLSAFLRINTASWNNLYIIICRRCDFVIQRRKDIPQQWNLIDLYYSVQFLLRGKLLATKCWDARRTAWVAEVANTWGKMSSYEIMFIVQDHPWVVLYPLWDNRHSS